MAKKGSKAPQRKPAATTKKPSATKKAVRQPRVLKPTPIKGLQRLKPFQHKHPVKLPSIWQLTQTASAMLWQYRRTLLGVSLVYGLLNLILVHGFSSGIDIVGTKATVAQTLGSHSNTFSSSLTSFLSLMGNAAAGTGQTAAVYQLFLIVFVSLAIIWALRQLLAGYQISIRATYYQGMYPIVPFILVLLVIGLELLPLLLGTIIYEILVVNGIVLSGLEQFVALIIYILLALASIYLLSSTLFALYIVSLPDMTPVRALRSARRLVHHRRWTVIRKILWLPLLLLVVSAVIFVPIIIVVPVLAQWLFLILAMIVPALIHGYMYTLYRELLNE